MARPKKNPDAATATPAADGKAPEKKVVTRTIVRAKTPMAWGALLTKAASEAWRTIRVEIKIRDKILAGKPANLDAATAMLKARGLEDMAASSEDVTDPTQRQELADKVSTTEGLCEFTRREGKKGIWMPSNNIKAGIKENWSVLGLRNEVRGSRGAMAEGLFVAGIGDTAVERDWIYLGEKESGVHTAVSHTTGPSGPVSSIKRHEYVVAPTITFDVMIATAKSVSEKISDDEFAKMLVHYGEHGMGACRSQGFGKFDIVQVYEVENGSMPAGDAPAEVSEEAVA